MFHLGASPHRQPFLPPPGPVPLPALQYHKETVISCNSRLVWALICRASARTVIRPKKISTPARLIWLLLYSFEMPSFWYIIYDLASNEGDILAEEQSMLGIEDTQLP